MPRKKPVSNVVKTVAAAAKIIGVRERTVCDWRACGCPGKRGHYDVDAIKAWRAENRKATSGTAADAKGERAKWAAKREKALAQREEFRLRRELGEYILVARAAQIVRQHIAEVVTHLDQLPEFAVAGERIDSKVKGRIRDKLRSKIRDMRITFERSMREQARAAKRDAEKEDDGKLDEHDR